MKAVLVSPEETLFEGTATSVLAPAYDGMVGILPRHAPMLALLGTGVLTVRNDVGEQRFRVSGGFVQVRSNVVRIVAEEAQALDVPGANS